MSTIKLRLDIEEHVEVASGNESDGWDMEALWNSIDEPTQAEPEPEESAFVKLTKRLLAESEAELEKWQSKTYKKSKGSVYVGSEMDGNNFSINYINNKRRSDAIKNALSDIAQYKKDLGIN